MRAIIIGAGVTGLATAHYLSANGHTVTVIDANTGPALGASYANGAQLSYSYVAPLAGPGVLPKVPPWLLRRDAPLRFKPSTDPDQWRWLLAFVQACTRDRSNITTKQLLGLSFHSRALMHDFLATPQGRELDFGFATNGKLVVFSDRAEFEGARTRLGYQRELGCEQFALEPDDVRAMEPALADPKSDLARRMTGAIHTPSEEVGDCYQFCVGLERQLRERGVTFYYGHKVQSIATKHPGGPADGVLTDHGYHTADAIVLASGAASAKLVRKLGVYLPVYPLKGYSLTAPGGTGMPKISITDAKKKIVYAPLHHSGGDRIRIAGMADIVGHKPEIDPERLDQLILEAKNAFPNGTSTGYARNSIDAWAGLRPATPRGTPILGATPIPKLFVNVGQGALGWTLALGSGQVVADIIEGRAPRIALNGLTLANPT